MAAQFGKQDTPMSQVELTVSCKNLRDKDVFSKSDPMCVLFVQDFGSPVFQEVGRTEQIRNSLNPEFAHKFNMNYYFEQAQKLKFELYDIDSPRAALDAHDFLGRLELNLGEIVGSPGSKIHRQLCSSRGVTGHSGSIIVVAEIVEGSKDCAVMQWSGVKLDKKDFFGKSDPFLNFYRVNDDNSLTLVHRTEFIKNSLNPTWKPFKIPVRMLCKDNPERTIRIDCFDYDSDGSHDLIGTCEVTLAKISKGPGSQNTYDLINPAKRAKKKGYKNSGHLQLLNFSTHIEYSFLDYVLGGAQLHFTVAVDFTASNGNPMQPNSLHYIHPHQPNQYMMALKAVGDIVQDYDIDKMFPALGFGAKLPNGQVSHEFFMNFNPTDPHCAGVNGILDAYRRSITSVQLYGPTNFSPVINHVAKFAAGASNGQHYFVLLIITDGVITDFEQTKAAIVNASALPMSIIIVGVGPAEFDAMDALDCDQGRLSSQGRFAERDIVQFVPFRNYLSQGNVNMSQARLAKDVLYEVPAQLTGWMQARGFKPRPPPQVNPNDLAPKPPPTGVDTAQGYPPQAQGAPPVQQGMHTGPSYPPQQGYASQNQPSRVGGPGTQYQPQMGPSGQSGVPPTGAYSPQQGYNPQNQPSHMGGQSNPYQHQMGPSGQSGAYPSQQGYPPQNQPTQMGGQAVPYPPQMGAQPQTQQGSYPPQTGYPHQNAPPYHTGGQQPSGYGQ